jgi:GTPase SAR1 family protein
VNLPVVLCANKSDLYPDVEAEKEMMPIMLEFKVRCVECGCGVRGAGANWEM